MARPALIDAGDSGAPPSMASGVPYHQYSPATKAGKA
jgi:hypothetical protein